VSSEIGGKIVKRKWKMSVRGGSRGGGRKRGGGIELVGVRGGVPKQAKRTGGGKEESLRVYMWGLETKGR